MNKKLLGIVLSLAVLATTGGALNAAAAETNTEPPSSSSQTGPSSQPSDPNEDLLRQIQELKDQMKAQQEAFDRAQQEAASSEKPAPPALTPNVLISTYDYGEGLVNGGQSFVLNFDLYNTSASLGIRNVVVKINGGETFALASGTDTLFIDSIAPQSVSSQSAEFSAALAAAPGAYPITIGVAFEYYDQENKGTGTADLSVTIPVTQEDKIRVSGVGFSSPELYTGEEYDVTYSIINFGFTKLYNAELKLLDGGGKELASSYLGTMEPSTEKKGSSDLAVAFASAGDQALKLKLIYQNEALENQELIQDLTASVMDYDADKNNSFPPMEEVPSDQPAANGPSPLIIMCIVAAVLVAAAVVTVVLVKRHKKIKRSLEEDEDI